jgi:uncharacterized membrane protein YqhA
MKAIEKLIELILWNSRMVVLIPVFLSLVLSLGLFIVHTVDALLLVGDVVAYLDIGMEDSERNAMRLETISTTVAVIDGYLLACVLLIFALGLYELFVNKIDLAEKSELAERLLLIRSLDDLKDRLANVILLILIVKFFQQAISFKYQETIDLLYLSIGVVLVAASLYLSGRARPNKGGPATNELAK